MVFPIYEVLFLPNYFDDSIYPHNYPEITTITNMILQIRN